MEKASFASTTSPRIIITFRHCLSWKSQWHIYPQGPGQRLPGAMPRGKKLVLVYVINLVSSMKHVTSSWLQALVNRSGADCRAVGGKDIWQTDTCAWRLIWVRSRPSRTPEKVRNTTSWSKMAWSSCLNFEYSEDNEVSIVASRKW